MNRLGTRTLVAVLGLAALTSVGAAQTPLGGDVSLLARPSGDTFESQPNVACDGAGACAAFWMVLSSEEAPQTFGASILPGGAVWSRPKSCVKSAAPIEGLGLQQGFAVFLTTSSPSGDYSTTLQQFDESLDDTRPPVALASSWGKGFIRAAPSGLEYVVTATEVDPDGTNHLALHFINHAGLEVHPSVVVDGTANLYQYGVLAVQPNGELVIVYVRASDGGQPPLDLYVRRLASDGTPLGPEHFVDTARNTIQGNASLAVGQDGGFIVVWQSAPAENTTSTIRGRLFSGDGRPLGDVFQVDNLVELDQRYPQIAADADGNYFVVWQSFIAGVRDVLWDIHGRLFRHDGTPVTHEIRLNQDRKFEQEAPTVTFAPHGIAVAGWHSNSTRQGGPVVRRFAASPGQEVCATWDSQLQCNLGRTGGTMQLQLRIPARHGEITLLGDVDGDGRDDVCFYLSGKFHCDLSHEGIPPGWSEGFGFPGDIPLLADVDGDGKADPCVRRKDLLICDTKHDGTESYRLQFGHGGELPLLGDLDGDGEADLCLVEGAFWNCLLSSTGERLQFSFGKAGDSPALGDVNLDGRADPCVLRKGLLSCNTRHDGGPADYTLQLNVPAGARLLFGNLDGL